MYDVYLADKNNTRMNKNVQVLGMEREVWAQLPAWKQMAAKRAKNLF